MTAPPRRRLRAPGMKPRFKLARHHPASWPASMAAVSVGCGISVPPPEYAGSLRPDGPPGQGHLHARGRWTAGNPPRRVSSTLNQCRVGHVGVALAGRPAGACRSSHAPAEVGLIREPGGIPPHGRVGVFPESARRQRVHCPIAVFEAIAERLEFMREGLGVLRPGPGKTPDASERLPRVRGRGRGSERLEPVAMTIEERLHETGDGRDRHRIAKPAGGTRNRHVAASS